MFLYIECFAERAIVTALEAQTNTRLHDGDLLDHTRLRPADCQCVLPVCCTSPQMTAAVPCHAQPANHQFYLHCALKISCEATDCSGAMPLALVSPAAAAAAVRCNSQLLSKIQCNGAASRGECAPECMVGTVLAGLASHHHCFLPLWFC